MDKQKYKITAFCALSALALAATPLFARAADNVSVSGDVQLDVEVSPAIAMTITGNNDDGSLYNDGVTAYSSVDTFSPGDEDFSIAGSTLDGHTIPSTAVSGASSSFARLFPSSLVEGSAANGFRSAITVYTNNSSGYTLSVKDSDSDTNLLHTNGTDYIPTTSSELSAGTAGWNYDVTKYGSAASGVWTPTATGTDAYTIENQAVTSSDITIDTLTSKTSNGRITYVDYNVATAGDQTSGIYSDTLIYTATADSASSDTMSISPSSVAYQTATTITATIPLYTTDSYATTTLYVLTSDQYDEVQDGTDVAEVGGTELTCSRTSSTPVAYSCTVPALSTSGTHYIYADVADYASDFVATYAIAAPPKFFTATYMQDFATSSEYCSSATTPTASATTSDATGSHDSDTSYVPTVTLTDSRDGNTYTVKKLADGQCWMTQNLRLVGERTLTSVDSDVSSDFTLTASNSSTWCTDANSACVDRSLTLDTGNTAYGVYYNFYAATGGTGTYSAIYSGRSATGSVCPKGWRLPTGGSRGEFNTLYSFYNSSAKLRGTPEFIFSGYRIGSSSNGQGGEGRWYASTAGDANPYYADFLNISSSSVNPSGYNPKTFGYPVRCLAR